MSERCGRPVEFTVKDKQDNCREVCAMHRQWGQNDLCRAAHQFAIFTTTKPQDAITSGCQAPKGAP